MRQDSEGKDPQAVGVADGPIFQPADIPEPVGDRRSPTAAAWIDRAAKRGFDIVVSLVLLLVVLPIVVLVACAIKLDSRGPLLYRARRVGRRSREFDMLKFRKMSDGASGIELTTSADPRFTRIGAFLAKSKLDEIPQLWNVLKGEMSLVGPRPEDARFVACERDRYEHILLVRPGVTGLSQLAFSKEGAILRADNPVEDYLGRLLPQKAALDCLYVARRSMRMDLEILLWTAQCVLFRTDVAVHRETGRLSVRRRPVEAVQERVTLALPIDGESAGRSAM